LLYKFSVTAYTSVVMNRLCPKCRDTILMLKDEAQVDFINDLSVCLDMVEVYENEAFEKHQQEVVRDDVSSKKGKATKSSLNENRG